MVYFKFIMVKKVLKKERHFRWNWEVSLEDLDKVRYHFIVVDDRNRRGKMNMILSAFAGYFGTLELVRHCEGQVKDSGLRYLFESYDINIKPSVIKWSKIGLPVVKDKELWERQSSEGIENYVSTLYG